MFYYQLPFLWKCSSSEHRNMKDIVMTVSVYLFLYTDIKTHEK